jgi:predicted glycosyltransferase
MRIFIDIGHPAHVHYFKNFIKEMCNRGHSFFITARNKEMAQYLLEKEGIEYTNRGTGKNSAAGKIIYMFKADVFLLKHAISFKPDIFIGFASFYTAQVSSVLRKPSIILDDTENGKFQQLCYRPFANFILSPTTFTKTFGKNHFKFNSFLELAYLHPDYFTPDFSQLKELNVKKGEKFTICRFVSWQANHDYGHSGVSSKNKIKAVNEFLKFGKVFISSESELPEELKKYQIKLAPEKIHHALSYATLLYGESATMASECAVLGTPAIYIDNEGRGYTDEQESKYQIVFNFTESEEDQIKSISKGYEILKNEESNKVFQDRRQQILNEKINFTKFLIWFFENYPKSKNVLKEDSNYQLNF